MADADLSAKIAVTSEVPDAMDKAKKATVSFAKQVEDIQKKFSLAFKDVFLSFLAPMALLGIVINYVGKLIDDNRKKHEDANQAAIDGTNALMSAEDRYWANKRNNEKKSKASIEQAATKRQDTIEQFLTEDPRGKEIFAKKRAEYQGNRETQGMVASIPYIKEVQDQVFKLLAEDVKKNPLPGPGTPFNPPSGFSNVVGVGPNPVIEAMSKQLEAQLEANRILEQIAAGVPSSNSGDFTKDNSSR